MKTVERHRLKDNEIAEGLHRAGEVWEQNSRTIVQALGVVALVAVLALGYWWWQHRRLEQASALLAEARSVATAPLKTPPPVAVPGQPAPPVPAPSAGRVRHGSGTARRRAQEVRGRGRRLPVDERRARSAAPRRQPARRERPHRRRREAARGDRPRRRRRALRPDGQARDRDDPDRRRAARAGHRDADGSWPSAPISRCRSTAS